MIRKSIFLSVLATLFMAIGLAGAQDKLQMRRPCGDGMVLQQNADAKVWGWARPGAKVTVSPSWAQGKSYSASADSKGMWEVAVKTPSASYTSYTIKVRSGNENLTVKDVLVGEVWFAAGQSNMEMPIKGFGNCPIEGAADVIMNPAGKDRVRMFRPGRALTEEVLDEVRGGEWHGATSEFVGDFSAVGYFFAEQLSKSLDIPVGIVCSAVGGSSVEGWSPKEICDTYSDVDTTPEGMAKLPDYIRPFIVYNAMLRPLAGYTVKGIIWYQGCANVGRGERYSEKLASMVGHWRELWGAELPFYQVQITPFRFYGAQIGTSPLLRQEQLDACGLIPNSSIVATNDLVKPHEMDQIHTSMKKETGLRLARLALNRQYGFTFLACEMPRAVRVYKNDGNASEIFVEIANCPNGLDRWQMIEGLEIADRNGVFKPVRYADFDIRRGALRIRSEEVSNPTAVRYCWGDFVPGNLHNVEGLPVLPFELKL